MRFFSRGVSRYLLSLRTVSRLHLDLQGNGLTDALPLGQAIFIWGGRKWAEELMAATPAPPDVPRVPSPGWQPVCSGFHPNSPSPAAPSQAQQASWLQPASRARGDPRKLPPDSFVPQFPQNCASKGRGTKHQAHVWHKDFTSPGL